MIIVTERTIWQKTHRDFAILVSPPTDDCPHGDTKPNLWDPVAYVHNQRSTFKTFQTFFFLRLSPPLYFGTGRYRYYIRITVYQKKKSDLHFSVAMVGTACRKDCRVGHG